MQMMPKFSFKQMIESFAGVFVKQEIELTEMYFFSTDYLIT